MGEQGAAGGWVAPSTCCRTRVPRRCRLWTSRVLATALAMPAEAPVAAAEAAARSPRRWRICCCCRPRLGPQPKQLSPFVPTYRLGSLVAAAAWHSREGLRSQGATASLRKGPHSSPDEGGHQWSSKAIRARVREGPTAHPLVCRRRRGPDCMQVEAWSSLVGFVNTARGRLHALRALRRALRSVLVSALGRRRAPRLGLLMLLFRERSLDLVMQRKRSRAL